MSIAKNAYPKKRLVMGMAAALTMMASGAVLAESEKYSLDIKSQGAPSALLELSRKSGSLIIVQPDVSRDIKLQKLQGDLTLTEALDILLKDSGLRYEFVSDGSVVVSNSDSAEADSSEEEVDEEVVVTGSRIRGSQTAAPTVSITRDEIERRGFSTVADLVRSLPQNYAGLTDSSHGDNSAATPRFIIGASAANLRGLGTGATLILVNNRRTANAPSETETFVDLGKFPIGMVERVEIITGGASAIYGSDAVGGVINIITRKDYEGAETTLSYESSKTNADAIDVTQMFGKSWDSGNITVNLNYQQTDPAERLALGITTTDQRSRGGRDFRTRSFSQPGILSISRNPAIAAVAPAGSAVAILPDGDGTNVTADDLIYVSVADNALQTGNWLLINPVEIGLQDYLTPENDNKSVNFTLNQELGESVQLYVEGAYSSRESITLNGSSRSSITVPASNAYNNFDAPILVSYSLENEIQSGLVPDLNSTTESISYSLSAGVKFDLPWSDWQGNVYVRAERAENDGGRLSLSLTPNPFSDPTLPADVLAARDAALNSSDPDTALNFFGDGTGHGSQVDFSDFIFNTGNGLRESEVISTTLDFNGSLFELPGGTVRASVGVEIREESLDFSDFRLNSFPEQPTRDLEAFFAELSIPLIGQDNALPLIEELTLNIAGRDDTYDINGPFGDGGEFEDREFGGFSPTVGLIWVPVEDLRLSFNWSEAFQAPTTQELFDPAFAFPNFFFDPIAPGGPGLVQALFGGGGNPDLQPQNSDSLTVQIQYSPGSVPGLSVGMTWLKIEFDQVIRPGIGFGSSFTDFLVNSDLNPGVQRDSEGNLIGVFFSPINAAFQRTEAVDFNITYDLDTDLGAFTFGLNGTYTGEFAEQLTPESPVFTTDGKAQGLDTWKVIPSVQWSRDQWSANAYVNFSSSFDRNDPDSPQVRVGSLTTIDAQVRYEIDETTQVSLGARNLFDKEAPFFDSNLGLATTRYDVRGRIWYMDFRKAFDI